MRIGLCGIVKNEAPYLIDWIAWYSALGFTDFIIADNESDDGTTEILKDLQRKRVLHTFNIKTRLHNRPQREAYILGAELAKHLGIDWVAFFDPDEYLLPGSPEIKITEFLSQLPDDCGALCIDWALYGSSGQIKAQADPTPYRFEWRAEKKEPTYYKTLARMSAYQRTQGAHHAILASGYRHLRPNGAEIDHAAISKSSEGVWEPFRLNHYSIRSWAEFTRKKLSKARLDHPDKQVDARQFFKFDKNDVHDPLPDWCRPRFEKRKRDLLEVLGKRGSYENAIKAVIDFEAPPKPRSDEFALGTGSSPIQTPAPKANFFARRARFHAMRLSHKLVPRRPPRAW